jgi:hypothetical protein
MDKKFRMDKTAFSATSFKEADNHVAYWEDKTYSERLAAAWFLIKHAYGIDDDTRMDKTVFECRRRNG